ncbi:hypothetical protein [Candidatus Enterococcus ikei]|uniref:Uncharacterized protein n=1 Tax=Candidatus Enterococcus ikei TaxID=2815326 RepID=A0ABS3GVH1_9ENTE|nr:hypothetical protein [Enterococcus sp. DIV0869a]MBO0439248.1 hypothetical protein [Enterococcus sp. DIV0869a]
MKKKWIKGVGIFSFFSFVVLGGIIASGRDWQDDYVYFSDKTLRDQVIQTLNDDGMVIENELPTIKQMQNYGMNASTNTDDFEEVNSEFSYELGTSIEGLQYFSNKVTKIRGSESDTRDIRPLLEMDQLEEVELITAFIDDQYEMNQLLVMPKMKKVEISDMNERFRDFAEIEIGDNLAYLRYENSSEYPIQYIDAGSQKFELHSPIRILENEDFSKGTLTYTSSDKNFSVDGQTLSWTKPIGWASFNWKYEYKQDGKDFELKGYITVGVREK